MGLQHGGAPAARARRLPLGRGVGLDARRDAAERGRRWSARQGRGAAGGAPSHARARRGAGGGGGAESPRTGVMARYSLRRRTPRRRSCARSGDLRYDTARWRATHTRSRET
eukprot:scaffold36396_cov63-Phaeocystis_antarctica.AAC.4